MRNQLLIPVLFLAAGFGLAAAGRSVQGLRRPVWAGQFYDADPAALGARIDRFLAEADPAPGPGAILALVVPHAGYVYSGRTAAFGYKAVRGGDYESVVILGPSHRVGFEGASIWPDGGFQTPLGTAAVDAVAARALADATGFRFLPSAHGEEHSVEVQVPFIQKVLPRAGIVPVVLGRMSEPAMQNLAAALAALAKTRKILVVASTDMSHYLPKREANARDAETAGLIREGRASALVRLLERDDNRMCGGSGVVTALLYAQKRGRVRVDILKTTDSSAAGGPDDGVVGYLSAAVLAAPTSASDAPSAPAGDAPLTDADKKELLALARRSVDGFVATGRMPDYQTDNPRLTAPRGAFVTLTKKGSLRGCIGFIEAVAPLYETVRRCAVYAASEDPRFPPVAAAELRDIAVEISVLTPPRPIADPGLVRVGKHGLIAESGGRRGLLLPQVAVENGWDREEFLSQTCVKAGLPPDAWKKGARISVFEAVVFH